MIPIKLRSPLLIAIVLTVVIIASSCVGNNAGDRDNTSPIPGPIEQPTEESTAAPDQNTDEEETPQGPGDNTQSLKALLPEREGYRWVANGFAEYGHVLDLEEIREEDGKVIYVTKGHVDDMSDGESDRDFSLEIIYAVTADSLIQDKTGETMMDLFDSQILIQLPLEEGNSWTQTVQGADGDEIQLESTIEKVEDTEGAKVYTVYYKDKNSSYFERRQIKEGSGVINFTRLFISEDESFEISYFLYEEASGYDQQ